MAKTKILYFDTETTGLDPVKNDIHQLGALLEIDNVIVREFNEFCRPINPKEITASALKVTEKTAEQLLAYQDPAIFLQKFMTFLGEYSNGQESKITLVGQNTQFDKSFLEKFFFKMGYSKKVFDSIFDYKVVDLQSMAHQLRQKGYIPLPSLKLEEMSKFFHVIPERFHDALADIKCTHAIFKEIEKIFIKNLEEIDLDSCKEGSPLKAHLLSLKSK
jgi:DNA polymerase III alpha subunit (gram-positive type)